MASSARHGEGQERDVARSLDGERHLALVTGAIAGDAPGDHLPAIADEVLERLRILVVDGHRFIRAELADPLAHAAPAARGVGVEVGGPAEVLVVAELDVALAHGSSFSVAAAGLPGSVQSSIPSSISSPKSLSGGRRGSPSGASTRPSAFSRDSSFSSSGTGSMRVNFTSSGSMLTVSTITSSRSSTVWNLSTLSSMRRLRSSSDTTAPPPRYFR